MCGGARLFFLCVDHCSFVVELKTERHGYARALPVRVRQRDRTRRQIVNMEAHCDWMEGFSRTHAGEADGWRRMSESRSDQGIQTMKQHGKGSPAPLLGGEYIIEELGTLRDNQAYVFLSNPQSANIIRRIRIIYPQDETETFGSNLYRRVRITASLVDEPANSGQGDEP